MIQSLHIFRKDARHLWMELALYAVLLTAFSVATLQTGHEGEPPNPLLPVFLGLLKILIPVIWLVIIARLIHDENLVGDQQFWVTRPYQWTSLLFAKLFFVAICIVLPFVVMQCALVLHAGLNPLAAVSGLLVALLYFLLWNWLPLTVLAAVTSTLSNTFMSIVAVVIAWAGALTILSGFAGASVMPPLSPEIFSTVVGGLLIAILIYQYAVRNTARSRIALGAAALLFLGLYGSASGLYFSGPVDALFRRHFPVSTNASLRLVFVPISGSSVSTPDTDRLSRGLVDINLPVHLEGLDPSVRLQNSNASFTVDAPGYHYTSPWRPALLTDRGIALFVPQEVFHRANATALRLRLSFVAERLLPLKPQEVTAADSFRAPDHGSCILSDRGPGDNLVCRYAYQTLSPTKIYGSVATQPCDRSGLTHPGVAEILPMPAGTNPNPVIQELLPLGGTVCPGTQLTFIVYRAADNFRVELDIPSITLGHYRSH